MNVLVISTDRDVHVERVIPYIKKLKSGLVWVKPDSLESVQSLLFSSQNNSDCWDLESNHLNYTSNSFTSLWIRKPYLIDNDKKLKRKEKIYKDFKWNEVKGVINSFMHDLCQNPDLFSVNDISASTISSAKLFQLKVAKKLGFTIPNTLVSSKKATIKKFIKTHENQCAIKSITNVNRVSTPKVIDYFTHKLTLDYFCEYYKKKELNYPLMVQEYIEKKYELRITVIGNKIFPIAIYSQQNDKSKTDYRIYEMDKIPHIEVKLPKPIEDLCFNLCRKLRLQYGAIDMAVTPKDEYIFFEINPGGQYLWLEDQTGVPLSEAMANLLVYPEINRLV